MFSLGDDEKVYCAEQVLMNQKDPGDRVVVVGGGLVGCEMALDLAQKGKKVTILEALPKIMAVNGPICSANKEMLEELLPFHGVNIICNAKVTGFKDGAVSSIMSWNLMWQICIFSEMPERCPISCMLSGMRLRWQITSEHGAIRYRSREGGNAYEHFSN